MDRKNFYSRQKVTETELDGAFDDVEVAVSRIYSDLGLIGILYKADVSQNSPTPNLTVDIDSAVIVDKVYRRIAWSTQQDIDCSVDENSVSTAVGTPGNERYLSIFAHFERVESDPRIDGDRTTQYFEQGESWTIRVVQAAEAAPPAGKPPLHGEDILLADIKLVYGQTQILDADIYTDRREWAIQVSSASVDIDQGQIEDALQDLADAIEASDTALADHIAATSNQHVASAVNYAGGGNWHDGTTNPAATVEAQLDKIITELVANEGSDRLGSAQLPDWHDGAFVTAGSIFDQLSAIVTSLEANAGSDRIGSAALVSGLLSLAVGSIKDQLLEMLGYVHTNYIDVRILRASNWSGVINAVSLNFEVRDFAFGNLNDLDAGDSCLLVADYEATGGTECKYSFGGALWWLGPSFAGLTDRMKALIWSKSYDLYYAGGRISSSGGAALQTHPTGLSGVWTVRSPVGLAVAGDEIFDIADDESVSVIVAVGGDPATPGSIGITRSTDGTTFVSAITIPTGDFLRAITTNNDGIFVAVGSNGSAPLIIYSLNDGKDWSTASGYHSTGVFYSVEYDAATALFYACGVDTSGADDYPKVYTSANGSTWTDVSTGFVEKDLILFSVACDGEGTVIVAGTVPSPSFRDAMYVTIDGGANWYRYLPEVTNPMDFANTNSMKFLNGRFFAAIANSRHLLHSLLFNGYVER